ncbi:MAG TPA: glycosyltransferase family 87 protein [Blastocatellia bacterium]|nr:glycosyltransferase family 87 protein [Blastocatellia bacterium]
MGDEPKSKSAQRSKLGRRKLVWLSVSAVILALLGLVFVRNLIDFPVYYAAGRSLLSGRIDLYSPDFARGEVMDFRYPPFFLLVFYPLWLLPYSAAAYVWYLFSVAEVLGCVAVMRRVVPRPAETPRFWIVTGVCVAVYYVMIFHYGNVHLLAVLLLFGALYLHLRGHVPAAALLMSLSITLKLTPAVMLPYFAVKKQWRFLLLTSVFTVVLNLAPAGVFGFKTNTDLLKTWFGHVIAEQEFHEANGPINLSLKGQLRRYLTRVDYRARVEGDTDYRSINLTALDRRQVDNMWIIAALTVSIGALFLILWAGRRLSAREREPEGVDVGAETIPALECGLMICLMLFIGPLTSKIYFIALLWPVASLAGAVAGGASRIKLVTWVLLAVATANVVLPLLPGRSTQRLLLVLGVDFYLNCLVMMAVGYALIAHSKARRRDDRQQIRVRSEARTS